MKSRMSFRPMTVWVAVLCCQLAPVLRAQNSTPAPTSVEAVAPASTSETRPVQLPSGAAEILKLGRAHVGDEVIIAFIRNSGRTYQLSASEIIYLRAQGVSDQVVTAMLSAQQNVAATAPQAAPQPAPTYDAAASVYPQPSSVYAYPAPSYGYYDYSPYYWGYPTLSLGFGFGGGYYGGYRWGGYYGGGYHGGGYHGGYYGGGYHGGSYHGGGYHGGGGGHR